MRRAAISADTPPRLLLSIHDVSPRFEGKVDRLRALLERHAPGDRIALLVVPDHWGSAPIVPGSAFATRLRGWADQGAEIFVHGWYHRDATHHRTLFARATASHLTAGEGEFSGLDYGSAAGRLRAGRLLLENVTGRSVAGFVAPAWLYSDAARRALHDESFLLAEDHFRVWSPADARVLARGPVLTWASRSRARILSSLGAAAALPPLLARLPTARIGVHPGDTGVPAILRSIDRSVARLRRTHRPGRYDELLAA